MKITNCSELVITNDKPNLESVTLKPNTRRRRLPFDWFRYLLFV